jgi:hypothetical protein
VLFVPLLHVYDVAEAAPFALSKAVCPLQIVAEFTVMPGTELTVTVATAVFVQELTPVPVTV